MVEMFFWKLSDIFEAIFKSETFWKTEISGRFCFFVTIGSNLT